MIPGGILQDYIFNPGVPKYLNYGALGMIIGHEMSHGFDSTGHKYDEAGKYLVTNCNSWTNNKMWMLGHLSESDFFTLFYPKVRKGIGGKTKRSKSTGSEQPVLKNIMTIFISNESMRQLMEL